MHANAATQVRNSAVTPYPVIEAIYFLWQPIDCGRGFIDAGRRTPATVMTGRASCAVQSCSICAFTWRPGFF